MPTSRRALDYYSPLWLLAIAILTTGCGGDAAPSPTSTTGRSPATAAPSAPATWFPIRPGAQWIYQGTVGKKSVGRKVFHCLRRIDDRLKVEEYIGKRLLSWGKLREGPAGWRYDSGLWLPRDLEPGRRWIWSGEGHYTDEAGPPRQALAQDYESVFVPALGHSVDALRVEYDGSIWSSGSRSWRTGWRRTRWWYRGLGVVREEMTYRPKEWGQTGKPDGARVELQLVKFIPKR